MTNKAAYMDIAKLKVEGALQDFDTGEMITDPERIAAHRAAVRRQHDAQKDFEQTVAVVPDVLSPPWLAARYQLAETADSREAVTYLRRLVLWRMASGKIEHPGECAAIVMPEGEQPYEEGW